MAMLEATLPSRGEVEALIAACGRSRTGRRNQALLTLMWRGGLRVSEACAVPVCDVDWSTGVVRVQRGKGGKPRTSAVGATGLAVLENWRAERAKLGLRVGPLCCTLDGRPVATKYAREMVKRVARRAGIDHRVHPHALRHAFAAELVQEGASVVMVRDLLGHSSLSVTDVYLRRLGVSDAVTFAAERS